MAVVVAGSFQVSNPLFRHELGTGARCELYEAMNTAVGLEYHLPRGRLLNSG